MCPSSALPEALTGDLPVVVFELDADGVFLFSRGAGRDAVRARTDDPTGRSVFELYADAPTVVANMRRALRGETFVARAEVPRPGQPPALFDVAHGPVTDDAGRVTRVVGLAIDVTERVAATRELVLQGELLRRLAARLQTEREHERARVSRAVHDGVGQALTALRFEARWLRRQIAGGKPLDREAVLERLGEIDAVAERATQTVQDLAAELRPPLLDALGLTAALGAGAERFAARTGLACRLARGLAPDEEAALGRARATAAYRIVQEAAANVSRHADASAVTVTLQIVTPSADVLGELPPGWPDATETADPRALVLEVADDGRGVPEPLQPSTGLTGMSERAAEWGGTLYVGRGETGGTVVRAVLPFGPEPPADELGPALEARLGRTPGAPLDAPDP